MFVSDSFEQILHSSISILSIESVKLTTITPFRKRADFVCWKNILLKNKFSFRTFSTLMSQMFDFIKKRPRLKNKIFSLTELIHQSFFKLKYRNFVSSITFADQECPKLENYYYFWFVFLTKVFFLF